MIGKRFRNGGGESEAKLLQDKTSKEEVDGFTMLYLRFGRDAANVRGVLVI